MVIIVKLLNFSHFRTNNVEIRYGKRSNVPVVLEFAVFDRAR